jgi:hypothetical protein
MVVVITVKVFILAHGLLGIILVIFVVISLKWLDCLRGIRLIGRRVVRFTLTSFRGLSSRVWLLAGGPRGDGCKAWARRD